MVFVGVLAVKGKSVYTKVSSVCDMLSANKRTLFLT